jgi:hypothetical protein
MASVALVTTTSPVPGDLGKKVVLHGIVEYLVDRFGDDDVHFVLLAPPSTPAPALPCRVHVVAAPTGLEQVRAAATGVLRRPHRSLQEAVIAAPRVARELGALLESAIDRLPDGAREVFMLRQVEGMSTAEVAEALGLSEDVVKTRLSRARATLRRDLYDRTGLATPETFRFLRPRCDRVVAAVLARIL